MEAVSTLDKIVAGDGARMAAAAAAKPVASVAAIWDAASRLYFDCRALGTALDDDWLRFTTQRGGLPEDAAMKLANEALAFFREKRAGIDAAVAAARKSHEERDHAQRHGLSMASDQHAWALKNLAPLWRMGDSLEEAARIIHAAQGKPNSSIYVSDGAPSIGDDGLLLETLLSQVEETMKQATSIIKLLRNDSDARERVFNEQIAAIGEARKSSKK